MTRMNRPARVAGILMTALIVALGIPFVASAHGGGGRDIYTATIASASSGGEHRRDNTGTGYGSDRYVVFGVPVYHVNDGAPVVGARVTVTLVNPNGLAKTLTRRTGDNGVATFGYFGSMVASGDYTLTVERVTRLRHRYVGGDTFDSETCVGCAT